MAACPDECSTDECMTGVAQQPQYRPRMSLPQPSNECNESAGLPERLFYQMQFRIAWQGACTINQIRIDTINKLDSLYGGCPVVEACKDLKCCPPDPLTYEL